MSSSDSTRKTPRWPPESAGFSTAGKPTSSAARRRSEIDRTAANRGCGTPASASRRRIAILCVIRCAVSVPIPGRPRASATAATTGTARSALTVSTPSSRSRARRLQHRVDVGEVDHLGDVGLREARRVGVAVDGHDAQAELFRLQDRAALVAAGADEENGLHGRDCYCGASAGSDERQQCRRRRRGSRRSTCDGDPVEHEAEEPSERLDRQVGAKLAFPLQLARGARSIATFSLRVRVAAIARAARGRCGSIPISSR